MQSTSKSMPTVGPSRKGGTTAMTEEQHQAIEALKAERDAARRELDNEISGKRDELEAIYNRRFDQLYREFGFRK